MVVCSCAFQLQTGSHGLPEQDPLGHLGLVAAMFDELEIGQQIDRAIPQDFDERIVSIGNAVKAMVLNGLGFVNKRLYLVPLFFETKPTERLIAPGIRPEHLNDLRARARPRQPLRLRRKRALPRRSSSCRRQIGPAPALWPHRHDELPPPRAVQQRRGAGRRRRHPHSQRLQPGSPARSQSGSAGDDGRRQGWPSPADAAPLG